MCVAYPMPKPTTCLYIIDDEPELRTAYSRLARSARMRAKTFASVREFLEGNPAAENACVICDIGLSGTSGIELPTLLDQPGSHIPVIFVTSEDTESVRERASRAGAAGYFRKPVDSQALLDAIAWALAKKLR